MGCANESIESLFLSYPFIAAQRAFLPIFFRDRMRAVLALVRDQERLGIMRRVAIDQYRITASIAPQMSIITSRHEAIRDGTKD